MRRDLLFKLNLMLLAKYQRLNHAHLNPQSRRRFYCRNHSSSRYEKQGPSRGDKVAFEFDAGRLIISPVSRRKYTLAQLLAMQGTEPLLIDKSWDTMPPIGQEVAL